MLPDVGHVAWSFPSFYNHHYHNGSFRPLLNSLGVGDDDYSPRACRFRTFLLLIYFLGCSMDEESLRVIIVLIAVMIL